MEYYVIENVNNSTEMLADDNRLLVFTSTGLALNRINNSGKGKISRPLDQKEILALTASPHAEICLISGEVDNPDKKNMAISELEE